MGSLGQGPRLGEWAPLPPCPAVLSMWLTITRWLPHLQEVWYPHSREEKGGRERAYSFLLESRSLTRRPHPHPEQTST